MRVAILVGMPTSYSQRIRAALRDGRGTYQGGWQVEHVPARRQVPEIRDSEIGKALDEAARHGGAHIIGVSRQDGDEQKRIAARIKPYFRFRWLKNRFLSYIGANIPQYFAGLNAVLSEEDLWATKVKPSTEASPLLLPKTCFETERRLRDLWDIAEQSGDAGMIDAAARKVEGFHERHWHPRSGLGRRWIDKAQRMFDHKGPLHGVAPSPRGWKYSFPIPQGFHYDVTSVRGVAFALCDVDGSQRSADEGCHLNVDPHGYIL